MTQMQINPAAVQPTIPGLSGGVPTGAAVAQLRALSPRPLEFWLDGEALVRPGYHVTEIKAVTVEAMDCGGKANAWHETVVQLMDGTAQEARAGHMDSGKFLAIWDRVTISIPVRPEAELRFEYGSAERVATQYHVVGLDVQQDRLVVNLRSPGVQCKAGDACGQPADAAAVAAETCAPGSGCCTPAAPDLISLG